MVRTPIRRVGIVARKGHPAAIEATRDVASWLVAHGREVAIEDAVEGEFAGPLLPAERLAAFADLIVVLGGDGTLIHAARLVGRRDTPIFGVNLGSLGFMTDFPVDELFGNLAAVLEGRYEVDERMKLAVQLHRGDGPPLIDDQVLNDVVISKGALARIADLEARIDGLPVTLYKADGVIVATPTGSTAYSLAASGPIVYPSLEAIVLTPICPHTLAQRPVVLPPDGTIEIQLTSDNGEVFLTLDGQSGLPMERGDRVQIRRAGTPAFLVRNPARDYFSILRQKLRWGTR
jgi:NAD+ kinase